MLLTSNEYVETIKQQIQLISRDDLLTQTDKYLVIDIRESNELSAGTLPGAIAISRGVLEMKITPQLQQIQQAGYFNSVAIENIPIVLYCQSGARSALAAYSLKNMGFKQIYSLQGGYKNWQAQTDG